MLSDALILVMWPKWVHKHLQEVAKKTYWAWKNLIKILDVINRKYFTLILKITILINCTGKFCYRHWNLQNKEAATEDFLKNFTKFIGKRLSQSLFFNKVADLRPANLLKKRLRLFCQLCIIFKNNFFASDSFSKYVWQWPAIVVR